MIRHTLPFHQGEIFRMLLAVRKEQSEPQGAGKFIHVPDFAHEREKIRSHVPIQRTAEIVQEPRLPDAVPAGMIGPVPVFRKNGHVHQIPDAVLQIRIPGIDRSETVFSFAFADPDDIGIPFQKTIDSVQNAFVAQGGDVNPVTFFPDDESIAFPDSVERLFVLRRETRNRR